MAMDKKAFQEHEARLFDAIRAGKRDDALAILEAVDRATTGNCDFAPGGPRRMFAEVDMDRFMTFVAKKEESAYNAIRFGDNETKLYIWSKAGALSTEWRSMSGDAKMWEDVANMGK